MGQPSRLAAPEFGADEAEFTSLVAASRMFMLTKGELDQGLFRGTSLPAPPR